MRATERERRSGERGRRRWPTPIGVAGCGFWNTTDGCDGSGLNPEVPNPEPSVLARPAKNISRSRSICGGAAQSWPRICCDRTSARRNPAGGGSCSLDMALPTFRAGRRAPLRSAGGRCSSSSRPVRRFVQSSVRPRCGRRSTSRSSSGSDSSAAASSSARRSARRSALAVAAAATARPAARAARAAAPSETG